MIFKTINTACFLLIKFYCLYFLFSCTNFSFAQNPEHLALVDTGYDLCQQLKKDHCEQNHNLLFRGSIPLPYDASAFKLKIAKELNLPVNKVNDYRIVIINLSNGLKGKTQFKERTLLQEEYKISNPSQALQQQVMYALDTPFDEKQFAFEWWPITLNRFIVEDKETAIQWLNWENKSEDPTKAYLSMDLLWFISNTSYQSHPDAKNLPELLLAKPTDGHPLLIFYHCIAGKDRTGVVSMAYFQTFGGYSNHKRLMPMTLNESIKHAGSNGLIPNRRAQQLARAYCLATKKDLSLCKPPSFWNQFWSS